MGRYSEWLMRIFLAASAIAVVGLVVLTLYTLNTQSDDDAEDCRREVATQESRRKLWFAMFDLIESSGANVRPFRVLVDVHAPELHCVDNNAVPINED